MKLSCNFWQFLIALPSQTPCILEQSFQLATSLYFRQIKITCHRQITCIVWERQLRLYALRRIPPIGLYPVSISGLDHAEVPFPCFMVASGGGLFEGYGHGGPGVCLGDGQTEAGGVPSQGGRGDALYRRMSPHLTLESQRSGRATDLLGP